MSPKDQNAINGLRKLCNKNRDHQRWYYSGSGNDISPTIIAPYDTEHWMVDVGYDATHNFFFPIKSQQFYGPFQKLGGRVETTVP